MVPACLLNLVVSPSKTHNLLSEIPYKNPLHKVKNSRDLRQSRKHFRDSVALKIGSAEGEEGPLG